MIYQLSKRINRGVSKVPYFIGPYKQSVNLFKDKVEQAIYKKISELEIKAYITAEPVPFESKTSGKYIEPKIGKTWGKLWDCAWFNFTGTVPNEGIGKNIVLLIDINGEACIFDKEGCPVQGLTNVNSEFDFSLGKPGKRVVDFLKKASGGEKIDIWADAGCNDLFGKYQDSGKIKEANIAILNIEMRGLYYDIEVLLELMNKLPESSARHQRILFALYDAFNIMKNYNEKEAISSREVLSVELNKRCGDESLNVSAIGHAHIDLAWLWPLRETIRKGARTFSTVLKNMDIYPDYVFGASQPQLYFWMKKSYPKLYEKIKERIAEGRWEAQGGMWVEADTNVTGGESLVRQLLYGKKFFKEEFNKDIRELWLPDVFGYSGALPQILKKSGIDYFMTIKLSWSEYNSFPHHTFKWEGIDGSQVLAHMPPEGTYNSSAAPRAIIDAEKNFKDNGVSENCLMLFGIGDGGGGPGEEHLERLAREKNLNGLLPVKQEPSIDFFDRIQKDSHKYKTWVGELYLEKHQGTYTTQARSKMFNRKMEFALRELEYASVLAQIFSGKNYPQEEIEVIWKEVLLYQFHDILPGSSIKRVYDESVNRYGYLLKKTLELTETAYKSLLTDESLLKEVAYDSLSENKADNVFAIINSLSFDREEWINIKGNWCKILVPSMSEHFIQSGDFNNNVFNLVANKLILENDLVKLTFDEDGSLKSVYDKENCREALDLKSKANVLTVYEEVLGDAWDFSPICYDKPQEKFNLITSEAYTDGPKAILKQIYEYNSSRLEQRIVLTEGSRRIDFITKVDWNENGKMLRTSFPVNVYTNEVTCDIQFGSIKRPNHDNTSWDMAKFEICAHKWVDMSQYDYGIALLNDSKYGHRVKDNVLDLNLLRSTSFPGECADIGNHEFTYSLYPHSGNFVEGRVVKVAYELNSPLNSVKLNCSELLAKKEVSFLKLSNDNIIAESFKKAEYNDDIILRLYESSGSSSKTKLEFGFSPKKIKLVSLMEESVTDTSFNSNTNELQFKPFEIHTLRITV